MPPRAVKVGGHHRSSTDLRSVAYGSQCRRSGSGADEAISTDNDSRGPAEMITAPLLIVAHAPIPIYDPRRRASR